MTRLTAHFEGRVQGVGFRMTTRSIAKRYPVAGYVENLPDGRVKCVAEGQQDQVESFINDVAQHMSSNITAKHIDRGEPTGEFGQPAPGAFNVNR